MRSHASTPDRARTTHPGKDRRFASAGAGVRRCRRYRVLPSTWARSQKSSRRKPRSRPKARTSSSRSWPATSGHRTAGRSCAKWGGSEYRRAELRPAVFPIHKFVCPPPPLRPARPARPSVPGERHDRRPGSCGPALPAADVDPGSYLVREFARHFVSVRAEAESGEITITKEAKDIWRAAPCFGPLIVVAQVYAYELSVRTSYLDGTRGYFNGASVFLCPVGREHAPCILTIAPPDPEFGAWRVATTLPAAGAAPYDFGRYRAEDYDELIDHPVEMGTFATARFTAGGAQHDIAISGQAEADLPRLPPTSRASANGTSIYSAARRTARRRSTGICSRSRPWATAMEGWNIARAPASCAGATNCRGPASKRSATTTSASWASPATNISTRGTSSASSPRHFRRTTLRGRTTRGSCGHSRASRPITMTWRWCAAASFRRRDIWNSRARRSRRCCAARDA